MNELHGLARSARAIARAVRTGASRARVVRAGTLLLFLAAAVLNATVLRAQDTLGAAQAPTSAADSIRAVERAMVILRAQRLVNDGNGVEGRALLDSLLNATPPRAPEEAEILFWRATLAESWDQAQRDYLRIMLEHEHSSRAEAAMLRLAQGEITRGDREAALGYLERLARVAPESELRAEAGLWQGRLLVERGLRAEGCAVYRANRTRVRAGSLELENQYEYVLRECANVSSSAPTTPASPTPTAPTPEPARPPVVSSAPAATSPAPASDSSWSVQIAAFRTAREAEEFAGEMRTRGYDTRVDGTSNPFRVRFGYYATSSDAAAAMSAYRTKEQSDAFITQVARP